METMKFSRSDILEALESLEQSITSLEALGIPKKLKSRLVSMSDKDQKALIIVHSVLSSILRENDRAIKYLRILEGN